MSQTKHRATSEHSMGILRSEADEASDSESHHDDISCSASEDSSSRLSVHDPSNSIWDLVRHESQLAGDPAVDTNKSSSSAGTAEAGVHSSEHSLPFSERNVQAYNLANTVQPNAECEHSFVEEHGEMSAEPSKHIDAVAEGWNARDAKYAFNTMQEAFAMGGKPMAELWIAGQSLDDAEVGNLAIQLQQELQLVCVIHLSLGYVLILFLYGQTR